MRFRSSPTVRATSEVSFAYFMDLLLPNFPLTLIPSAEARAQEEKYQRRASRRRDRNRDEYEEENSEDEYAPRKPKMLEAPSSAVASQGSAAFADFVDNTTAKDQFTKSWNDKAADIILAAGAISPSDGRSPSNHVLIAQKSGYASSDIGTKAKTIASSPAVQGLLSRWLGDNASAVFGKVIDGSPSFISGM
jgi:hypothetical protein